MAIFMNERKLHGRSYMDEPGSDGGNDGAGGASNSADSGDAGGGGDLVAQLAALQAERDAVLAKNNELLGEVKKFKSTARETAAQLEAEARAKAEAEGNYQQLYESSEKERSTLQEQLESMNASIQKKEISQASFKLASELADGANIDLLSEFVMRRLKFTDEGIKVTDEAGNLTVSSLDDLKNEFKGSARYASLIKGNQSSGGGAAGGSEGGGAAKVKTRAEFDALTQPQRLEFVKSGGKVKD